jgi:hypothetical protein
MRENRMPMVRRMLLASLLCATAGVGPNGEGKPLDHGC